MVTNNSMSYYGKIYSDLLECSFKKFNLTIYNSSQYVETKLIQQLNSRNTANTVFDPYDHDRDISSNYSI